MMDKILLVGAGGHARVCADVIKLEGRFTIAGLLGMPEEVGTSTLGLPVLGTDADLSSMREDYRYALVTVGQIKTPAVRIRLFDLLEQLGFEMPVIVSPKSYVSEYASLGAGTIVMHGAVVNAGAEVGRNCILNSQSLVEHDARIGDHCHISTSAAINGDVRVGRGTFVGSNTAVRNGISIGENCVIGMGQNVLADCEPATRLPFFGEKR